MSTQDKNSSDVWADDRLGRSEDATFLRSFLVNRINERKQAKLPASYVLNIDAQWGQGKSFFLSRFGKMLREDHYLVAEVNAWQDDHADDPLLSVMDAIDQAVSPLVKREKQARDRWDKAKRAGAAIAVAAAKGAAVQVAKKVIGSGVEEIGNIIANDGLALPEKITDDLAKSVGEILDEQGKVLLERFREGKKTIAKFRESLNEFLAVASQKDQPLPLFVLIDELDRCRPPFAIAMLERVKHLFEIDQVIFVLATDTTQLSHSIAGVYGGGFNSSGYLSRFFNRTYYFESVSRTSFVEDLLAKMPIESAKLSLPSNIQLERYLTEGFDFFGLSLRDIEQVYDILRSVVTVWNSRLKIEICLLFPIAVAQQQNFPLLLDSSFGSNLNRLHQKLGGSDSWTIPFTSRNYRQEPPDSTSAVSLASEFVAQSERTLNDLNYENAAPHARWVTQRLSEEFQIAHGSRWRPGAEPISIVRRYPDLVRSAGRLLPQIP